MRKTPIMVMSTERNQPQSSVPRVIGTEVMFDANHAHQYSGKLSDSDSELSLTDEQVMQ